MYKIILKIVGIFCLLTHGDLWAFSALAGGTLTTPEKYQIQVTKIEFRNTSNVWQTFVNSTFNLDLAAVNPGSTVQTLGESNSLPVGTYNRIRVTFSRSFVLRGAASDGGTRFHTESGNPAILGTFGGITNPSIGTASPTDAATDQTLDVPSNATVTSLLNAAGITESGSDLLFESAVSFTILDSSVDKPGFTMTFNVANAMEFFNSTGLGIVFPLPPEISIS